MMTFREFVIEFRGKSGLTQQALADKIGIHKRTIQEWERFDGKIPNGYNIARLSHLSKAKTSDIISYCQQTSRIKRRSTKLHKILC